MTGPDGYSKKISYKNFAEDGTYTLDDLETGEYQVVESGADFYQDYKLSVSYGETAGKAEVKAGVTAGVTVTNTYSKKTGTLEVKKTVNMSLSDKQKEKLTFTVTGPDGYRNSSTYDKFVNGSWKIDNLPLGEYTVTETDADISGYSRKTTYDVKDGKTEVKEGQISTVEITNTYTRESGNLKLKKVFVGEKTVGDLNDEQKAAIKFTVIGPDGYHQTISYKDFAEDGTYTLSGLSNGEYQVEESGADIYKDYKLNVSYSVADGKTTVTTGTITEVTITNTYSKKTGTLEVDKIINGVILTDDQKSKLTFTVTGPNGYSNSGTYDQFVNGSWKLENLPLGDYTVTETNADIEGYKLTTTYSVDGGKATVTSKETATVTITNNYTTNKKTSVKISKVDAETYKLLGGAHLMVIDPDGNVVAEWDSTKNAHKITGLKPGVTYTLRETKAPKGYDIAADTTFELNEDGTINTANTTTSISGDALLVKDEKTADKTVSVSVTKRLVTVDGQVIGAPDATYYVALYSDPDCTQRVSDVMALNYKNASVSTVTFTGLKKGQTYYVGECEADGTSYLANVNADGTLYTVDFSDGNTVEVTNNDGSKTIYFDNQFEKVPDGYYKEGELNITKKLVGGDGKAKNSSEIFYAGIFSDADFTQLSPDVSDNIVPLDLAGGSEVTSQVKVSIPESGSITLYVTEVDSEGNPVAGAASFKYDVSVDNMQVTFDDDNISADVVITNSENTPEVTPTPTTTTPNTPVTQSGSTTKSAVKTGDSTPIGMFVGLFAAAAVIAGAAVFFKRRKK